VNGTRIPRISLALAASFLVALSAAGAGRTSIGGGQKSIGAGVGANPLRLSAVAHPGHTYRMPSLYVVNTGDRVSTYAVQVRRVGDPLGHDVPATWIHLARMRLRLRPHASAVIPVRLIVPRDAAGGNYATDLVVGTSTRRPRQGTALGAAAAAQLGFSVGAPGGFSWNSPWLIYLLLALFGLAVIVSVARRFGLRIEVERRR
jgi:hypothetical protein